MFAGVLVACTVEESSESVKGDPDLPWIPETGNPEGIDQSVFGLLNLDYPCLESVKNLYEGGDFYNAAVELLEYYRERPVYNPNVNMLQPSATATEISLADQASNEGDYRFKVYEYVDADGKCWSFKGGDGNIDWTIVPESLAGEKEFSYQLHRHQWMLPQAKAFKATGDEKYIKAWIDVYFNWLETYPCPEGRIENQDAQPQWYGLQTSSRTIDQMDILSYYVHSELFTPEVLSKFLVAFSQHVESIMVNWFKDSASNIRLEQEQAVTLAGIMMPEFKRSAEWFATGNTAITSQLTNQFNADGVHNEFDPSYHLGAVANFYNLYKVAQAN
jgi:heparan-sulfate lyase